MAAAPVNSISQLANAPAAEAAWRSSRTISVRLSIADAELEAALRDALARYGSLEEAEDDDASIVITDHAAWEGGEAMSLIVGSLAHGRNALASRDPALIFAAVQLVAAGYTVERPMEAAPWLPSSTRPHLSHREQQVASLLLEGASNKLIARALDISVHTAKFHVTAILDKLGARNRADAVSIILREGLIAL